MIYLTDEQIEEILQGRYKEPANLHYLSRKRLEEMRQMQARLRKAFATQHPSEDLAERIRLAAGLARETPLAVELSTGDSASPVHARAASIRDRRCLLAALRVLRPVLAAAAAVLMFAIPAAVFFRSEAPAGAAQTELVRMHERNLLGGAGQMMQGGPQEVAEFLRSHLGYVPAMPCAMDPKRTTCCCVTTFRSQRVGSYVIKTPHGEASIIVLPDSPESLGFRQNAYDGKRMYWLSRQGGCNMALVRLHGMSYCAVGGIPYRQLQSVLNDILTAAGS